MVFQITTNAAMHGHLKGCEAEMTKGAHPACTEDAPVCEILCGQVTDGES